ncbi:PREDICTED: mesothelin-like, partial [Gekko japonicus]|uniref:Mesothelin-like n=1 Tax=Gekko japonicus TaxID=146911 RepID=A0ABM1K9N9_GEKJA
MRRRRIVRQGSLEAAEISRGRSVTCLRHASRARVPGDPQGRRGASRSSEKPAMFSPPKSLPDHLVCNLEPEAVSPLSQNDALTLAERISKNCVITHRKCPKTGEKRMLPFQVAVSLVSKFNEFSPDILTSLGQAAAGLSEPQIVFGIRNDDLLASLPSLSKVRGWNAQQAEAILSKLFQSGYQIQDGRSLAALGSLLAGLDLDQLQEIPPSVVLDALKVPGFATLLENLSPSQKKVLVDKLIAATDGFKELVERVPVELVPYVPKSLLVPVGEFSIQDLNGKPWTQEQAAMFFDDVIGSVHNFSSLCPSILHGFTCATARNLDTERLRELAKAMKEKKVQLGKHQLLCLAERLMLRGIPHDFNDYPEELVLFVSPSDYGAIGSCKEYFARVGKANVDVLEKGSSQRERLLAEALDCLKISGPHVSRGNAENARGAYAEILGRLACDLSAEYFKTSGRNLLKQLRECRSFSPDQVKAIQALLCSGNTPVGPPSEWTSSTLEELSGLFHVFDRCILQKIPASVLTPRLKCLLHKSHLPRKDLAAFMKNLWSPRLKRSSGSECPPDKIITDEMAQDELLPIDYTTAEELRSCLPDEVFLRNLGYLSEFAFADEQLAMMKDKLDRIYSDGYPDSVLRNLGNFMTLMTPEDIKKWKFNSSETLAALLANEPSPEIAAAIIRQYIDNGGPVDGILGRFVPLMTPEDIKKWRFNSTETLAALLANDTSPEL